MGHRARIRGGAAAIVAVVVMLIALTGGAYYWFVSKGGARGSAFDLARHVPQSARAVWLVSLPGQVDARRLGAEFKEIFSKIPAEEQTELDIMLKDELGTTREQLAKFFDGRLAMAVLPGQGSEPSTMALVGLRDAEGFDAFLRAKTINAEEPTETIAGLTFHSVSPSGILYAHDGRWAYFVSSKAAAEIAVAAAGGKEALASDPRFAEAKMKVSESGSASVMYWDIASTVTDLQAASLPYTDAQTFKDLACLSYGVVNFDLKSAHVNGFLKITDPQAPLAQKLLAKGSVTPASFGALSRAASSAYALDLEWTFQTVVSLMMLSPESRQSAGMASLGLAIYGNPFASFEGDLAVATDVLDKSDGLLQQIDPALVPESSGDVAPQPSAVLSALVKDPELAHALLSKGLGEAAGAAPKAGEDKTYPAPPGMSLVMQMAAPQRLIASVGEGAAALADTQAGSMADNPKLKVALAWAGEGVIYADYLNLRPLVDGLEKRLPADQSTQNEMARAALAKLKGYELEGASCLVARDDGLQWRAFGGSGGVLAVAGVGGSIMVPNFIRARAQGQATACKSNLKNIATALEMYSTDHAGSYPNELSALTPDYLKAIPACPAANGPDYRLSMGAQALYNSDKRKDYYYVHCPGELHSSVGIATDLPAYSADLGLLVHRP